MSEIQQIISQTPSPEIGSADEVSCRICRGKELKVISRLQGRSLLQCRCCRVVYPVPFPVIDDVLLHFEQDRSENLEQTEQRFVRNRRSVLKSVSQEVMKHLAAGRILDVGCAVGYFLTEFFSSEQWSVYGVELSSQMASIASSRGIKTISGELRRARYEDSSFDAVTILDAFYYFVDPYAELAEIKRILKSGGVLVIELPNAATRIWRSENVLGRALSHRSGRLLHTSDHIFYYNRRSISMLLQCAGFTVKCVKGLQSNRQRNALVNALYRAFDLCCTVLEVFSLGRVLLNARFLVVAEPVSP